MRFSSAARARGRFSGGFVAPIWEVQENDLKKDILIRAALILCSAAALIALPMPHVFAQSCAMCYQGAAASGAQGGAALLQHHSLWCCSGGCQVRLASACCD